MFGRKEFEVVLSQLEEMRLMLNVINIRLETLMATKDEVMAAIAAKDAEVKSQFAALNQALANASEPAAVVDPNAPTAADLDTIVTAVNAIGNPPAPAA